MPESTQQMTTQKDLKSLFDPKVFTSQEIRSLKEFIPSGHTNSSKPAILIPIEIHNAISETCAKIKNTEWSCHGLIQPVNAMTLNEASVFVVTNIFPPGDHFKSAAYTEAETHHTVEWLSKEAPDTLQYLCMFLHSHNSMGVTPSGTDRKTIEENDQANGHNSSISINIIVNNKGEYSCLIGISRPKFAIIEAEVHPIKFILNFDKTKVSQKEAELIESFHTYVSTKQKDQIDQRAKLIAEKEEAIKNLDIELNKKYQEYLRAYPGFDKLEEANEACEKIGFTERSAAFADTVNSSTSVRVDKTKPEWKYSGFSENYSRYRGTYDGASQDNPWADDAYDYSKYWNSRYPKNESEVHPKSLKQTSKDPKTTTVVSSRKNLKVERLFDLDLANTEDKLEIAVWMHT